MSTKDLYNNVVVTPSDIPANRTGTLTGAAIDTAGYQSTLVCFDVGNSGDTLSGSLKWTLTVEESDASGSGYTAVAADDLHNGYASYVIDAPAEDSLIVKFGYKGNKRYLRGVATVTGSHSTGTPIGIFSVKGHPHIVPVAAQA